ncbi:hypothetical protein P5G65_20760 [Paenibacillus chondroitinus]|uniref:Uncharacterized protein n=1 Tax=Paenibacillus chondroitinus TaxID=59842 RepID=A0ABU6DHK8_9BACL|nr:MULTISPECIES: hypothetical protein [Paenibacillus]MCY9659323.1 hypothetical protein [Paenibacillus anseongense]MEB4796341.1 hypothetical protein [Paenibacillus chondroitinus]
MRMRSFKTKLILLVASSSLMLPSAISAATETENMPAYIYNNGFIQTNVHGTYVPGYYLNVDENTVAAFIPGGVGLVAVDKDAVLPEGSRFIE